MFKRIKMGMIGGGTGAFIGNVHRMAAALDGQIELVAGAFSASPEKSLVSGEALGLDPSRIYNDYREMIQKELQLPEEKRIDFISIVTPNFLHFEPAKFALENGFHVFCEKPLCFNVEEAELLTQLVEKTGLLFGLTHNYTGYPMVKEARSRIASGSFGKIRKILAEYPQGWLSSPLEATGQKQADWRTDPSRAGISCCVADIGTHAENLIEYITGLQILEVAADVSTFVEGRLLDDDANILVRFSDGAKGVIVASQIACGDENELKIRIYGENGGLEWLQSDPNKLIVKNEDGSRIILKAGSGNAYLSEQAIQHTRVPGGHPEGYIESMANLYRNFAFAIQSFKKNQLPDTKTFDFPTIKDGYRGMKFINAVIHSGKNNGAWVKLNEA